ncbi:hypothetical protein E3O52_05185 [Enterococcus faecium]|nr:hypothetical protein E3O52_05185 [Enterococcus faecium]
MSLTLFYRSDFLFCMDFFIYTKYFTLSSFLATYVTVSSFYNIFMIKSTLFSDLDNSCKYLLYLIDQLSITLSLSRK